MPTDNLAISVRNLTKIYRLFDHPGDRIKQFLSLGFRKYYQEFTALRDVSFDIKKGETVGIIGRNGSGKSTLLQLICGILRPTSGIVQVNGRVSALLELGAGFNLEFTGRENIYFQGAIMGLSREEMNKRFEDIADFADIGDFIDLPVRIYSSGMFVRLAFAVAINLEPDILLIDEALSVGDVTYQSKCFNRIKIMQEKGTSILLVTHVMEQIAHFCDYALLLDRGKMLTYGKTTNTLAQYINHLENFSGTLHASSHEKTQLIEYPDDLFKYHPAYNPKETRWGDRAATIVDVRLSQDKWENPPTLKPGLTVEIYLSVRFNSDIAQPIYGLSIKSQNGAILFNTNSRQLLYTSTPSQKAGESSHVCFTLNPFLEIGDYFLSFGVVSETPSGILPHDRRYDALKIRIAYPVLPAGNIAMNPALRILDPT